jgi:hypothetical protein
MTITIDEQHTMLSDLMPQVKKAAKSVAYQWPGVVDQEDMEQSLSLHLLERDSVLQKLYAEENKERMQALVWWGNQIAKGERADYEAFTGNFRYSVNEVKRFLAGGLLRGLNPATESSWTVEDYISTDNSFEDGVLTRYSTELDLTRAMKVLAKKNHPYARAIIVRYLLNEVQTDGADRVTLSRAVKALTDEMNRSFKKQHADAPDGPGTRTVVSNAAAASFSTNEYHGDRGEGRW